MSPGSCSQSYGYLILVTNVVCLSTGHDSIVSKGNQAELDAIARATSGGASYPSRVLKGASRFPAPPLSTALQGSPTLRHTTAGAQVRAPLQTCVLGMMTSTRRVLAAPAPKVVCVCGRQGAREARPPAHPFPSFTSAAPVGAAAPPVAAVPIEEAPAVDLGMGVAALTPTKALGVAGISSGVPPPPALPVLTALTMGHSPSTSPSAAPMGRGTSGQAGAGSTASGGDKEASGDTPGSSSAPVAPPSAPVSPAAPAVPTAPAPPAPLYNPEGLPPRPGPAMHRYSSETLPMVIPQSIGRAQSMPYGHSRRSRVVSAGSDSMPSAGVGAGTGAGAGAGVMLGGGADDEVYGPGLGLDTFDSPGMPTRRDSGGRFDGGSVRHGSVKSAGHSAGHTLQIGHGLADVSRGKHGKPVQQLLSILVLPPDIKVNLGGMVASRAVRYLGKLDSSVSGACMACAICTQTTTTHSTHTASDPAPPLPPPLCATQAPDQGRRDSWWAELRAELLSHAARLGCSHVVGYRCVGMDI